MIMDQKLKIIQVTSNLLKKLNINSKESIYLMVERDGKKINLNQEQLLKDIY